MKVKPGSPRGNSVVAYVFAVFWSAITIMPLLTTLLSSFKSNPEIFSNMLTLPQKWLFRNYYDALFGANILRSIINSMILGLGTSLVVIIVSMLASYVFSRKNHFFVKPLYLLFLTGLMLPVHTAIIPLSKIAAGLKLIDSYLYLIPVYAAFQLPQAIFLATAYINSISRELDEAATIDGCNMFSILYHIFVPISAPIISTIAVLSFVYGYSELIFSIILLTDKNKFPVSRALMFFTGERVTRMGPVFAAIIIAVIPMITLYIIFHEKVQKGMVAGAVKG
ncbi:MAG: carbohydrate ABC transporter permease [Spirochaetaceae bacterium]|jgi:raffinose/stachyose/melibiose transport system permease protein|nr:carbohydrate ABC transporter permease [Spirochaetaceae bacterium]